MSSIETQLVETWLASVLPGDATLDSLVGGNFVGTLAPLGALQVPAVVWTFMSTRDIVAVGGEVIDTDSIYLIKGVAATSSWSDVEAIATRIHDLVHAQQVTLTPSGSLTCRRDRIHQQPEEVAGQQYRHLGGYYRIRCSAT